MRKDSEPKSFRLPKPSLWLGSTILASAAIFSACEKNEKEPESSSQGSTIAPVIFLENPDSPASEEIIEAIKNGQHFWEKEDLAITKYTKGRQLYEETRTFNFEPPFYKGPKPLKISLTKLPSPGAYGVETIVANEFDNFTNFFVYENLATVVGAQTYDKDGNLLAEAYLEYPTRETINTQDARFYLHEVHYAKGKVIFKAKSELDRSGIKINETETEGKKKEEYYFYFPRF